MTLVYINALMTACDLACVKELRTACNNPFLKLRAETASFNCLTHITMLLLLLLLAVAFE